METLNKWEVYNKLQITLKTLQSSPAFDDGPSASQEIVDKSYAHAVEAIENCFNSQDGELSQSFQPLDVEKIIKTYLLDTGRPTKGNVIKISQYFTRKTLI